MGQVVRLGRASWVGGGDSPETCAWLRVGDTVADPFRFADQIRDGAEALVAQLQKNGYEVILMSGDTTPAVEAFADRLGIDRWIAEALPEDKAARVAQLTESGKRVLMVGDGLNDTAALAGAHASISPASALDAARVASDVVLLGKSLDPIADALATSRVAIKRIRQNFTIATWYNIIAVPLAVAGLCSPLIAALAMSSSSVTVSLNALRLK
jgi:Cu2+-exporting ATPase